jgi:hypothetical protein
MPEPVSPDWSQRFQRALEPSTQRGMDRLIVVLILFLVFALGVMVGMTVTTHGVFERSMRESDRVLATLPTRPTVHERLDDLEQLLRTLTQERARQEQP